MEEESAEAAATCFSALSLSFSSSDDDEEEQRRRLPATTRTRRSICYDGCGRPSTVCICPFLPPEPIQTSTKIILLHHPHVLRRSRTSTLSTVSPLSSSLLNLHLVCGRKLRLHSHPLLDSLYRRPQPHRTFFLFPSLPSSPSLHLSDFRLAHYHHPPAILIVFDGTWSQATEMVGASLPFLSEFATHVTIGDWVEEEGPSSFESELAVRKEPAKGCVSTMEAVARALRVLEVDEEVGIEVEERLLGILKAMVGFQMEHVKPVKPRVKTRKKKETRKQQESGTKG